MGHNGIGGNIIFVSQDGMWEKKCVWLRFSPTIAYLLSVIVNGPSIGSVTRETCPRQFKKYARKGKWSPKYKAAVHTPTLVSTTDKTSKGQQFSRVKPQRSHRP